MAGAFTIDAVFRAHDRMTRPISRIQRRMRRFGRATQRALRGADRAARGFGRGLARVAAGAAAAGAAVVAVGANVVRTGADFERSLTTAATRMSGSVERGTQAFSDMEAAARRVGSETEFTASGAAEALGFLAAAGMNAEQSIAALPQVVDLATASGLELARASDIITDSMGPLGLATQDAAQMQANMARVSDVFSRTASSTNTNVEQMFEAIRAGGNVATSAGQSVESFGALVGSLAQDGTKGAEAGTALRNMFLRLQAPSASASRALRGMGIAVEDGQGDMRDMVDIIADLSSATSEMGGVARSEVLADLFGARAVGPAISLLNQGADSIRGLRNQLTEAGGATAQMAGQMRDTTSGDMASFTSAVESIKLAIFEVVRGPLREILRSMIAWARANREVIASGIQGFINWIRDNSDAILTWGRRIGIAVAVLGTAALAVLAVSAATAVFNAVLALNPIGLIVLAIVAAVALIAAFWPEISAHFELVWMGIKLAAGAIADFFVGMWDSIVGAATTAWDWISGVFTSFVETATGIFSGLRDFIAGVAVRMIRPWMPVLQPVMEFIGNVVDRILAKWNRFKMWFQILWPFVRQGFAAAWGALRAGVGAVTGWVTDTFGAAWDAVVARATLAFEGVKLAWGGITGFFSRLWSGIVDSFNSIVGGIIDTITHIIGGVEQIQSEGRSALGGSGGSESSPQVSSPQERASSSTSESHTSSSATVEIRDRTGRAQMSGGGPGISFQPSGAMG